MNFTDWKYYTNPMGENVGIVSPDGLQSRLLIDIEVAKWLEESNTPLPAENT